MAELVDASDLKSDIHLGVPVRLRLLAPKFMLGSSIGLGHRPFTAGRGVRFPYRAPCLILVSR